MAVIQIEVDESFCEGNGYCVRICAEVFRVDPVSNKAVVLKPLVDNAALIECAEHAETTCPTRAILLTPVHED